MKKEKILIGKEAIDKRKQRIAELVNVVKGNRGWREAFFDKFPEYNSVEGVRILDRCTRGSCDEVHIVTCLEEFIPWVEETKPEWFVKQFQVSIP